MKAPTLQEQQEKFQKLSPEEQRHALNLLKLLEAKGHIPLVSHLYQPKK